MKKATCSHCGRTIAVHQGGKLYAHGQQEPDRDWYSPWCPGSNQPVAVIRP